MGSKAGRLPISGLEIGERQVFPLLWTGCGQYRDNFSVVGIGLGGGSFQICLDLNAA